MLRAALLMATTIVSNIAVFSDATGHGNQSHLVYAANQQRWWLFVIKTKTANVVSCYVSSSNDLTTATWSASTDSPTLTQACSTNDQRNLGVVAFANGSTDVAHVDVTSCASASSGAASRTAHIRCTFTGASSISWESWNEVVTTNAGKTNKLYKGNTLGVAGNGSIHRATTDGDQTNGIEGDPNAAKATNADTTSTWTNGWGNLVKVDDSMSFACSAFALCRLASNEMLIVFENSSVSDTTGGGLRYNKTSSQAWPNNTGNADVGIGTSTQDQNDWCLCRVDDTHIYAFRRSGTNTYVCRKYDGSSWSTPASTVPNQNHLAGSGMFAATDGTDLYLFVLDSASNQPVQYVKGSTASGTISFGTWTQLEAAGSAARNFISGYPVLSNSQVGVIYTVVNGSNFDVAVSALSLSPPPPPPPATSPFRPAPLDGLGCAGPHFANPLGG